jgi:hypothetical protein
MKGLENLILLDNDTRTEEEDEVEVEVGNPSSVNQVTNGTTLSNRMSDLELRNQGKNSSETGGQVPRSKSLKI